MTLRTTRITEIVDARRARLLHAIRAKQGRMTDRVFARRLGVPAQAISAARDGPDSLGIPLLMALVRAYPDLEEPALTYLLALLAAKHIENEEDEEEAEDKEGYGSDIYVWAQGPMNHAPF